MKKTILAFSVLTLFFTSCKKDNKDEFVPATKEDLSGTYKMKAFTSGSGAASVDLFKNFTECSKDDIYKLNADNSYAVEDAGVVCSPSDDNTGTWSFVNATTINLDGEVSTIKSWDKKTLVLEFVESGVTYTATYEKK